MRLIFIKKRQLINYLPLLRISHLLVFNPLSTGSISLKSSNKSFISLRLFLSANLWLTRNSGDLEYGAWAVLCLLVDVDGWDGGVVAVDDDVEDDVVFVVVVGWIANVLLLSLLLFKLDDDVKWG